MAKRLDIPSSTIRYYEKRGLIPPPDRVSGVREFNSDALATLRFIQLGQTAGFTINELQRLLECYLKGPKEDSLWQPVVEAKRKEIREKIKELKRAEVVLGRLTACQCTTIEECVTPAFKGAS